MNTENYDFFIQKVTVTQLSALKKYFRFQVLSLNWLVTGLCTVLF